METVKLTVNGMTCGGCVRSVTNVLTQVPGVKGATVSLERKEAEVTFDPAVASIAQLKTAVEDAGFEAP
jgi:copper chaperone